MSDTDDQSRVRVLFALGALSAQVQAEVLSNGSIQSQFQIQVTRPVKLSDNAVIAQQDLFAAFARAATGTPTTVSIRYEGAPLDCKVWIEADAAAVLEMPRQQLRFAYAALLVEGRERRLELLATILSAHTLTQRNLVELRRIVGLDQFGHGDFLAAVELLNSSPEEFARSLGECLKQKAVGEIDLLPEDIRHWDNLTASPERSETLHEFIGDELATERTARVDADFSRGLISMALTFAAPELVPREWIKGQDVEAVTRGITEIAQMDDHFSLVGAFEICTDWVAEDGRFVALGERLLDRLFADTESLMDRCRTFAAAFVLASARLALHAHTREQPVYWRRLAAVSHAGLVVRAFGASPMEREGLLRWALQLRRFEYLLSVYLDMAIEPQWRPEWLDPGFLAADAFGRVYGAMRLLPAGVAPASWEDRLEVAKKWIDEKRLLLVSQLAAVLQGSRKTEHPVPSDELRERVAADYRLLEEQPSAENLIRLMPWIEAFGVPTTASAGVHKALEGIRKGAERTDADVIQTALSVAAHSAVLSMDVTLADAVAEACLQRLRTMKDELPVADVVFRLVECAAADTDRMKAREALAKRLERLSFSLPTGTPAAELVAALYSLQRLDVDLAAMLGRAMHAAKLAASGA